MSADKEIAIYYPYMDLTDSGFIWTAALYWDELRTIVPESIQQPYNSPTSREASSERFLRARTVHSSDSEVVQAGEEFLNDIQDKDVRQSIVKLQHPEAGGRRFGIHHYKLSPDCLDKLVDALQDILRPDPVDEFIRFPEAVGMAYMSRLASVLARKDNASALTGNSSCQNVLVDKYYQSADPERATQAKLAILSLETISISPAVPLKNILSFRDQHRDDLLNFRRSIRRLCRQIGGTDSYEDSQAKLKEIVKDEVLPTRHQIEERLKGNRIAFGLSAFDMTQAVVLGGLASGGENWVTALMGVGISLAISLVKSQRQDRQLVRDHPFAYLYKAEKHFGGRT